MALRGHNDILTAAYDGRLGGVPHLLRTVPGAAAATNSLDSTVLHVAAGKGHAEMCRVLLAAGAEVDARNDYGLSALKRWIHSALGDFRVQKKSNSTCEMM